MLSVVVVRSVLSVVALLLLVLPGEARYPVFRSSERVPPAQTTGRSDCEYWVAPDGNDSYPGSAERPWVTLTHAAATVPDRGCTVWFRDGTYRGHYQLEERFSSLTAFRAVNPYKAVLENEGTVIEMDGVRNVVIEGFEIRHSGPTDEKHVVIVDRANETWSEHVTFRNNIFHDSYNDDLLKIHNGVRFVTVEGNVFYNNATSDQHMDINSATDVVIQDNIFFNDFARSGRDRPKHSKHFIVVKDSGGDDDGLVGSERITIRRNVFANWEGGEEPFLTVGNDGKPYHEAKDVQIENNLMIGNAQSPALTVLAINGAKDVGFVNNTVTGDLPAVTYGFRVGRKDRNPRNENVRIVNNIWSDPTATMDTIASAQPEQTTNLVLDNNLYWKGGAGIPLEGVSDFRPVVADPRLNPDQQALLVPYWNGSTFLSGSLSIREEFVRLVELYGRIPADSPAADRADPALAPPDDILARPRGSQPDLGTFEGTD